MKKILAFGLMLILLLTVCDREPVLPDTAEFPFSMPDGYSVANVGALNCGILRDSDQVAVGGMEVVPLNRKDLTQKSNENILQYLQGSFHQTNNVEFIASKYSNKNFPVASINMLVHREEGVSNNYTHYFFETSELIYHLWLNADVLGEVDPKEFLSCVCP